MKNSSIGPEETLSMAPKPARRPYHAPRMEHYGKVSELTRTSASGSYPDGGTFPDVYTSAV
jgi:hypothetical protein